jgi:two-component system, cell cycle response regulator DivK
MTSPADWHILVVEDEPDGQEVIAEILKHFNMSTDQAMSAEEALSLLGNNTYTGIIIDLALPRMDGIELVQKIRQQLKLDLPCVAITAFHSSKVKQQALEAGCDSYFAKPFDHTSFIRELDRLISHHENSS